MFACLVGVPLTLLFWFGIWLVFARPLRKRNRAICLLSALRFGLGRGLSVEDILQRLAEGRLLRHGGIRRAARSIDATGSAEQAFHDLGEAVPPQVRGFLAGGARLGDLNRVLPLAERIVARQVSRTQAFTHYLFLILFYWTVLVFASGAQTLFVPKYMAIFDSMLGPRNNPLHESAALQAAGVVGAALTVFALLLAITVVSYTLDRRCWPIRLRLPLDFVAQALLPWRRKRSRRDFALMLGACLDAGLQEADAVQLAAASTGDEWLRRQGQRAAGQLAEGASLPDVCAPLFDPSGELAWRLRTAQIGQNRCTVLNAIEGWCGYLEAGAYRDEQAAAQFCSTVLLLVASLFVGLMAYALLHPIAQVVEAMALW